MTYEVKLTVRAVQDYRDAYEWYSERSLQAAEKWFQAMEATLDSLKQSPERCPLANENSRFPIELRQLNFGSGRKTTHRIIFAIRPKMVVVYAIRQVAQGEWQPDAE